MATVKKNLKVDLLEYNEGQLSFIDEATNKQMGLPRNPRFIRDARFEALKKSIEDAPEMLDLRELLVYTLSSIKGKDGKYIVVGGNMRLRACKEIGYKEVPCKILDINTPMEKLREYAIKDNEAFGQNDFDVLANEWDSDELLAWGMDNALLNAGDYDFDSVDEVSEDNYNAPEAKMLRCPHCHHVDFAIHFKKVDDGEAPEEENAENEDDVEGDDLP
ncbi:MAG: ParB N-terminal domain-containing protein [Bacteroidales bacterium]|nr:ParB N-terminal domain-containing protein [Bacteroidales bacterium]